MNDTHRRIYLQKARDVAAGRIALLKEAPAHVPVLAQDLAALLEELDALERPLRATELLGRGQPAPVEGDAKEQAIAMLEGMPRAEVLETMRCALERNDPELDWIDLHRSRQFPSRTIRRALETMTVDDAGMLRRRCPEPLEWETGEEALLEASDGERLEAKIDLVHCLEGRSERHFVGLELACGTVEIKTECATVDEAKACAEAWRSALGDFNRYMRERLGG